MPTWVQPVLPSGERWILYEVAPLEADHPSLMSAPSGGVALSPGGGGGGGGPPPRKMPPRTALGPGTRVTVIVTSPPAATLIGRLTQSPWEKSVETLAAWGPEPSLTAMVSRRPAPSQS